MYDARLFYEIRPSKSQRSSLTLSVGIKYSKYERIYDANYCFWAAKAAKWIKQVIIIIVDDVSTPSCFSSP